MDGQNEGARSGATRKPRKKARRTRSPHPGVVLLARKLPSGSVSYRARYTDPDTGAVKWATLDASLTTREQRTDWAKKLSQSLARRRADRAAGIAPPPPPPALTALNAALESYLEVARVRLRPRTLSTYALAFERFKAWAKDEGVTHAEELSPKHLAALRDALIKAPKKTAAKGEKRGRAKATSAPRSAVSINRELRTLGTLLTSWRRREIVSLTSDQIADAMRALPLERELPRYLPSGELVRLLAAALRHDAETFEETRDEHAGKRPKGTTPRYDAIAPFAAFLILTGCRRGEALTLRWSDVDLDALDASGARVGEIRLRAADVKTGRARVVGLEVSPALRRILAALKLRRGSDERVFQALTDEGVSAARARLMADFGAPSFTWKDLRSTCSTYLVNAPGIYGAASVFLAARQLGHSVVVAERRYAGTLRGLPRDARTLEAAMQIEKPLADVLGACVTAPAAARGAE